MSCCTTDLEVNVKDHGAVGDGVTDDTAAFTAAAAAASAAGLPLRLPAGGRYGVHDWTIAQPLLVLGRGATVLRLPGTTGMAIRVTAAHVRIEDLTVDGNPTAAGGPGAGTIDVRGDWCELDNVTITTPYQHGVRTVAVNHFKAHRCKILNPPWNGGGIYGAGMLAQTYTGWEVTQCLVDRLNAPGVGTGIGLAYTTPGTTHLGVVIDHNFVLKPFNDGICIEVLVWGHGGAYGGRVTNNFCYQGKMGLSFGANQHTIVTGNVSMYPVYAGIEYINNIGGTVDNNIILSRTPGECGQGIIASCTIGATFGDNTAVDCLRGFYVWTNASGVIPRDLAFNGNVAVGSVDEGFKIRDCGPGTALAGNVSVGGKYGFALEGTYDVDLTGNRARDASIAGCHIKGTITPGEFNGAITGNNFRDNPTAIAYTLNGSTIGQLTRWANAGDLPDLAGYADLTALLVDRGVIVDTGGPQ